MPRGTIGMVGRVIGAGQAGADSGALLAADAIGIPAG